jgi:hypothetical protein
MSTRFRSPVRHSRAAGAGTGPHSARRLPRRHRGTSSKGLDLALLAAACHEPTYGDTRRRGSDAESGAVVIELAPQNTFAHLMHSRSDQGPCESASRRERPTRLERPCQPASESFDRSANTFAVQAATPIPPASCPNPLGPSQSAPNVPTRAVHRSATPRQPASPSPSTPISAASILETMSPPTLCSARGSRPRRVSSSSLRAMPAATTSDKLCSTSAPSTPPPCGSRWHHQPASAR